MPRHHFFTSPSSFSIPLNRDFINFEPAMLKIKISIWDAHFSNCCLFVSWFRDFFIKYYFTRELCYLVTLTFKRGNITRRTDHLYHFSRAGIIAIKKANATHSAWMKGAGTGSCNASRFIKELVLLLIVRTGTYQLRYSNRFFIDILVRWAEKLFKM